jgi:hypothetical protein
MEFSFTPLMARFMTDAVAALQALSPLERSLAAVLVVLDVTALVALRALSFKQRPAEETAQFDEAA